MALSVNDGNSFPKKCMALASAPRIIYFLRLISFLSSLSVILSGSEHTFLISFADLLLRSEDCRIRKTGAN